MTRRVLVVSHEASRTGAPRVAVEVLRSLAPLGVRRIALLRWDGPMKDEFRAHAEAVSLEPIRRFRALLRRQHRTRAIANRLEELVAGAVILRHRPHVVYLNTVKSASYIRPALLLRRPVVLHVHELEPLASQTLARFRLERSYTGVHLVACSAEVRDNLALITGVDAGDIVVVQSAVDQARIGSLARRPAGVPPVEPPGAVVVGSCGLANTGKGVDIWLDMAGLVRSRASQLAIDVRFVWVGREDFDGLADTLRRLGLEDVVRFTGDLSNPYPEIASFDVFTHTARQDSFPLAILEAMALGRPVVAFDVGGIRGQLGDTGVLVPAGDVEAMAEAVTALAGDAASRGEIGSRAGERAARRFSIDRLHTTIRQVVGALAAP